MSTITKEQAKDLRNAFQCWQQDYDPAEDKEQYDMFGLGMVAMDALLASLEAEALPEWTNEQCLEFLSIAFRHAEIKGDLQLDDIRLGVKMVNAYRAAPPAPVSVPDDSAVELLATDLMKRIDKITGERHSVATLSSLRVSIVESCRAAMLQGVENAETLTTMQTASALDSSPKNAESPTGINQGKSEPVTTSYKLPEGWVAVPVEPTEEMIAAAMCSNDVLFDKEDDTLFRVQHEEIWRAMLSTAPQQEVK